MTSEGQALVRRLAEQVRARLPAGAAPQVALVLGSGLGAYADRLGGAVRIPYAELPGFPRSSVVGHAGNLVFGEVAGVPVLAMQGRVHFYEGHDLATVVLPIRVLAACGCRTFLLTNAAGGIGEGLQPGTLVLIRDHLNLLGGSPLRGPNDDALGPRFPDMTEVYDAGLRRLAQAAARAQGIPLPSGVYAGCPGPQYETPAEVQMLRRLGADLVGMSTVPEAIVARHLGARVLGISCVTNLAAGLSGLPLSHDEVTETAARVRGQFMGLLDGILERIGAGQEEAPDPGSVHAHAHEDAHVHGDGDVHDPELAAAARLAQQRAYAPYSKFRVGAAVRTSDGRIFTGANVENASYGLTICAERNALSQAALSGVRMGAAQVVAVAVVSDSDPPAAPCGMCRQTLAEFATGCDVLLLSSRPGTRAERTTLAELLPRAFRPMDLLGRDATHR